MAIMTEINGEIIMVETMIIVTVQINGVRYELLDSYGYAVMFPSLDSMEMLLWIDRTIAKVSRQV